MPLFQIKLFPSQLRFIFVIVFCLCISSTFPNKVSIWVNSYSDLEYYRNMVKLYQTKMDSSFDAQILSYGFEDMPNKLALAMKTGVNPPDIVQLDELHFSIYLNSPKVPFIDLSKRVEESGLNNTIHPNRMGLFRFKNKTYGIPQSMSAVVLYYRSDLFQELKINPEDINTWDKFVTVGKKIRQDRRSLVALDWSYVEILLKQRGLDLFKADGSSNLMHPQVQETIEFLVNLSREGVGENPDRGNLYDPTFFTGDIANGEVLSVIGAGWYGLDMLAAFTPDDLKGTWRFMPLPKWTDSRSPSKRRTSTFSGQGLLIYHKSKQVDKAWMFMEWVMSDIDANVERYLQGNAFPSFVPSWIDGRLNRKDSTFNNQSLGAMMVELANDIPPHIQSPLRAKLINLLREKYWFGIISGSTPVEKALKELEKELKN